MFIHLVTTSTGFPNGTAAANRIKMIAKALKEGGCGVGIYTNSVENNFLNTKVNGLYDDIPFLYLHETVKLNISKIRKIPLIVKGIFLLFQKLARLSKKEDVVYLYSQGDLQNIVIMLFCKFRELKIVQEINEWHSDFRYPYEKTVRLFMVKYSDGAIIISNEINNRVLDINPKLKTTIIPILQSPSIADKIGPSSDLPYCFWMGLIDGYLKDILFIIEACGKSKENNPLDFNIVLSGPFSQDSKIKIIECANKAKFPINNIILLGYIEEKELNRICANAFFYIIPMWNDQRSNSRFPTKLATFMFFGKPVITCEIGEIGKTLTDKKNVIFYKSGEVDDLSLRINEIFENKELYKVVSENSKIYAFNNFNYKNYSQKLIIFFKEYTMY